MILVDSSVWIDHFRKGSEELKELLHSNQVLLHDFVIGELALGNFRNRTAILQMLNNLPKAIPATADEIFLFIDKHRLYGLGIGYIDSHLLASAILTQARLWTNDKKLKTIAAKLGCSYDRN